MGRWVDTAHALLGQDHISLIPCRHSNMWPGNEVGTAIGLVYDAYSSSQKTIMGELSLKKIRSSWELNQLLRTLICDALSYWSPLQRSNVLFDSAYNLATNCNDSVQSPLNQLPPELSRHCGKLTSRGQNVLKLL